MYYIYVVKCRDDSLYTGIAADIVRRMKEHLSRGAKCAKYTKLHPVVSMQALFCTETRSDALRLEAGIKKLPRKEKQLLIEKEAAFEMLFSEKLEVSAYKRLPVLSLSSLPERTDPS